jgi:hypothetical protein
LINKTVLFLLGLSLFLAACQGRQATGETPAAGVTPVVTLESFAASPSPVSQQTASPDATGETVPVKAANCTVVSIIPTPGPTEQSLFPPVGVGDWTQGPDTAGVTFIEYSDFM